MLVSQKFIIVIDPIDNVTSNTYFTPDVVFRIRNIVHKIMAGLFSLALFGGTLIAVLEKDPLVALLTVPVAIFTGYLLATRHRFLGYNDPKQIKFYQNEAKQLSLTDLLNRHGLDNLQKYKLVDPGTLELATSLVKEISAVNAVYETAANAVKETCNESTKDIEIERRQLLNALALEERLFAIYRFYKTRAVINSYFDKLTKPYTDKRDLALKELTKQRDSEIQRVNSRFNQLRYKKENPE